MACSRMVAAGRDTPSGQRPDQLAESGAHRVLRIGGGVLPVEDGHHQAERLGGGEHQRRQAKPATDPVAAVRAQAPR